MINGSIIQGMFKGYPVLWKDASSSEKYSSVKEQKRVGDGVQSQRPCPWLQADSLITHSAPL